MKEVKAVRKNLKDLDAEIRTITKEEGIKGIEYNVDVGIFESLGETAGDILTLSYTEEPTQEEIKRDLTLNLLQLKDELWNNLLSSREEKQLSVLLNLNLESA